jgi:hypothetical protein
MKSLILTCAVIVAAHMGLSSALAQMTYLSSEPEHATHVQQASCHVWHEWRLRRRIVLRQLLPRVVWRLRGGRLFWAWSHADPAVHVRWNISR